MKIKLEHLTKRFPNRTKNKPDVIAVDDFNIEIPDGKLVGLLGPSGCGKSTALNLISGLETPSDRCSSRASRRRSRFSELCALPAFNGIAEYNLPT